MLRTKTVSSKIMPRHNASSRNSALISFPLMKVLCWNSNPVSGYDKEKIHGSKCRSSPPLLARPGEDGGQKILIVIPSLIAPPPHN